MLKRTLDIILSLTGLIILSPVFIICMVLIKCGDGGSVFYLARRVGLNGRRFGVIKFRTMVPGADKLGSTAAVPDDPRMTGPGRILRKYKLDELPQLVNVLKGEMSLVGPRPQVEWVVEKYTEDEKKLMLSVRPGLTDYASLKFCRQEEFLRGSKDPDGDYMDKIHPKKMRFGKEYIKKTSIKTDFKIIAETFLRIIRQ